MINEILLAIFFVTRYYPKLFKIKIIRIYKNRFKSKNLYKFCYLKGHEDKNTNKTIIYENDQIKIKKVTSILYDFGNTIDI